MNSRKIAASAAASPIVLRPRLSRSRLATGDAVPRAALRKRRVASAVVTAAEGVNAGTRRAICAAADSPRARRVVRRHGMKLGAGRFVAGETIDEAVPVLRRLNEQGLAANTTLLGESVRDRG